MIKSVLIAALSFLLLTSCQPETHKIAEKIVIKSDFNVKIQSVAGEIFKDEIFKPIPTFFNIGLIKKNGHDEKRETIVLSNRLKKGANWNVKPIGMLQFKKDTSLFQYIISVPNDSTANDYKVWSYHQLSQEQYQLKYLIEDWFRSTCKLGKCKDFKWMSEIQALKLLN